MSNLISKADLSDVAQLNTLVNSAYRGESSRAGWTTEADFLDGIRTDSEQLAEIISRPGAQILKCVNEENQIIACVHLERKKGKLYLGMLTVSPRLQNQGIGKLLLNAVEQESTHTGCTSIFMTVLSERIELIAWYERHGYVNTRQINPFPMGNPKFGLPKKFLEFVVLEKKMK